MAAAVSATIVARQTGLLNEDIFAGRATFDEETGEVRPVPDGSVPETQDVTAASGAEEVPIAQETHQTTTEPALAGANRS